VGRAVVVESQASQITDSSSVEGEIDQLEAVREDAHRVHGEVVTPAQAESAGVEDLGVAREQTDVVVTEIKCRFNLHDMENIHRISVFFEIFLEIQTRTSSLVGRIGALNRRSSNRPTACLVKNINVHEANIAPPRRQSLFPVAGAGTIQSAPPVSKEDVTMSAHASKSPNPVVRWFVANTVLTGLFALLWLLFRSGTKPSRLAYPCQQAAFTAASLAFGAPLVTALITARRVAGRLFRSRRALATAAVGLFVTLGLWGVLSRSNATSMPKHLPPPGYRASVFHVTNCPQEPVGDRFIGLDNLLRLMGENGTKIYNSPNVSWLSGPDGIIGSDDVVVIKINYQWTGCGGTNTDLLRGLIRALVDHPDGFTGEIVVGENTQFAPIDNFDRTGNNSYDRSLSPLDVVVGFQAQGYNVSTSDWRRFRLSEVDQHDSCDQGRGYVVLRGPDGNVSYPRFQTDYGTCVDLRNGVWDPDVGAYDRDRLKMINLPVLKPHGLVYAVTACVKNYMGVVTNELNTNSHNGVRNGLMGAVMAETGPPDLNILDCIWIEGNPYSGPGVRCGTRMDQLVASTDPIAADIWATTNILIPAFLANGFSPPWPSPSATPDDPNSVFRTYLDNSMDKLLAAGYEVTNDLNSIDAYSWDGVPAPRRGSGRMGG
jgi:hypothetical protein